MRDRASAGFRSAVAVTASGLAIAVVLGGQALGQSAPEGAYRYAGGRAQYEAVRATIASATQALPRGQRGRLAGKLEEVARPVPELTFARQGRDLSVALNSARDLTSPHDGRVVQLRDDLTLRQHMDGNVLQQQLVSSDLTQTYRYALSSDGQTLTVSARLSCPEIDPITCTLTYTRL